MKSIIISALVFASLSVFSSNIEAAPAFKAIEANHYMHFELNDLQKPELEEALPSFVMQVTKDRQHNAQEELICLLNQIRKPEAEEELPTFIM
jgi:hypothetical protein